MNAKIQKTAPAETATAEELAEELQRAETPRRRAEERPAAGGASGARRVQNQD